MGYDQNLARNLALIRSLRRLSMEEFAGELGIAKSTLQSILQTGNTTLDTLLRISGSLKVSLDTLVNDGFEKQTAVPLKTLLPLFDWFRTLNAEQQQSVIFHLEKILDVLRQ